MDCKGKKRGGRIGHEGQFRRGTITLFILPKGLSSITGLKLHAGTLGVFVAFIRGSNFTPYNL